MKTQAFLIASVVLVLSLACNLPRPAVEPALSPTPAISPATPTVAATPEETASATPSPTATPASGAPTETPWPAHVLEDARGPGFAAYSEIAIKLPQMYAGYPLPVDLGSLLNFDSFTFDDGQQALLSQNGFVVVPADWYEFYQLYESVRYDERPVFVTTDSVYHIYHLIFDKMLRDLEREHFEPDIRALTNSCLQSARALYEEQKGTPLEETARRVVAYFAVADALIEPEATIPPEVEDLVAQELALIESHAGMAPSPIFSRDCPAMCDPCATVPRDECLGQPCMCEDYSQYQPRGHYTRSEQLKRYFRTMMWYGRINMRLAIPGETRMALLITYILRHSDVNGVPATEIWARVYDPTAFIVGKADDLGFYEYGALWDAVFGPDAPPSAVLDQEKLDTFTAMARQLPPPQVNSMWVYISEDKEQVTQGFRFMGQRFTLDAYIFDELTWREVGDFGTERWLPKGLDVMAALGSDEAYSILDAMGETDYLHYPEQMAKLREEISALQIDSWTQNLYWAWLYSFHPLLEPKGEQYPAFMRTQAWTRKDLHTALGSWAELKHDTILYAKQVMAEMGGGPPPEPPRGWVEPNPEAYARLLALVRMTSEGLENRGLLTSNTAANLTRLDDLLSFLLDVAQRELNNEPLTVEDYERIKYYGGELEVMTLAAADQEGSDGRAYFEQPEQAAVIADVATDPNGFALEEAIGRVFEIYVVIPDYRGHWQIATGGVFSYYEFAQPLSERLTDEEWRAMLEAGHVPPRPQWTGSFVGE